MPYHKPILAYGKSDAKVTTAPVTDAATIIPIDNSGTPHPYLVGDHVFISESDDTENQYLGTVTAETTTTITVSNPVQGAKLINAKVWQPTTYFAPTYGPGWHVSRGFDTRTEIDESEGGLWYPVNRGDPMETVTLVWPAAEPTDWDLLQTFLCTNRTGATKTFSLGWWDHVKQSSRVVTIYALMRRNEVTMINRVVSRFSLHFGIVTDDTYVTV